MKHEGPNLFGRNSLVPKFLVSLVLSLSVAIAVAQTRTISIDLRNVSVKTFLAEVESRSNYTFAYNNAEIDLAAVVSIKAESEDIVAIVDRVLGSQNLKARIEGNRVILAPAANAGTAAARADQGVGALVLQSYGHTNLHWGLNFSWAQKGLPLCTGAMFQSTEAPPRQSRRKRAMSLPDTEGVTAFIVLQHVHGLFPPGKRRRPWKALR